MFVRDIKLCLEGGRGEVTLSTLGRFLPASLLFLSFSACALLSLSHSQVVWLKHTWKRKMGALEHPSGDCQRT